MCSRFSGARERCSAVPRGRLVQRPGCQNSGPVYALYTSQLKLTFYHLAGQKERHALSIEEDYNGRSLDAGPGPLPPSLTRLASEERRISSLKSASPSCLMLSSVTLVLWEVPREHSPGTGL